jgi:hypothetical protein
LEAPELLEVTVIFREAADFPFVLPDSMIALMTQKNDQPKYSGIVYDADGIRNGLQREGFAGSPAQIDAAIKLLEDYFANPIFFKRVEQHCEEKGRF